MTFSGVAHASEAFAQDGGGAAGMLSLGNPLFLMLAMLGIFYFLLIRPQQKKQKELKLMLASLQKGDVVFTVGGVHGKITSLTDTTVTLEVADRVRIKFNRSAVAGLLSKGEFTEKEKEITKE
ncbi:MAG: preprotein translocase subunit YajC [Syntrophobacteraceae bacterium]